MTIKRKKIKSPTRIGNRRGGFRAINSGYTSNQGGGCGESFSLKQVVETLREMGREVGLQVTVVPPDEEQTPQGAEGSDTETTPMTDLSRVASMSDYCAVESIENLLYYSTLQGEGNRLKKDGVMSVEGRSVSKSKSDAMERAVALAQEKGARFGTLVTLKKGYAYDKYKMLKVVDVKNFPAQ